jgi:hypothetical protein
VDCNGRTIWIADAHRDDRKPFVVRADEKLTTFIEIESAIRACCLAEPKSGLVRQSFIPMITPKKPRSTK